jgi:hypothetical protein
MRNLSIALALSILWLVSLSSAQTGDTAYPTAACNNSSGQYNSCFGDQAGNSLTSSAQGNTFAGYQAGFSTTTGGNGVGGTHNADTFFGYQAGFSNTTAGSNAFFGTWAGYSTTGNNNTFLGNQAGETVSTGNYNTYTGTFAGQFNPTGTQNSFYGYQAGGHNTASNNIFMGYEAGTNNTTGGGNIYIGNQGSNPAESNTIRIGTEQTATFVSGVFGVIVPGGVPVYADPSGQLGTAPSSQRFKEQIADMGDRTSALMKLRPVTFLYKPEYAKGDRALQYGLIAEEVAEVYPELVAYDKDSKPYSVRYQYLATMLLNEMQKQYRHAEDQSELIKAQQQEIEGLKRQLQLQNATLQERLTRLEAVTRVEMAAK